MVPYNPNMLAPESWRLNVTFLTLQHGGYWMSTITLTPYNMFKLCNQLSIKDSSPRGCCNRRVFHTFSVKAWHGWSIFHTDRDSNDCNMNTWCDGSLYSMQATCFQHQFAINIWVTVTGDLTSPHKLLPWMQVASYLSFLMENLHQFAINIWVTVTGDLTSPHKQLPWMQGASYLSFVMENLPQLLET